MDIFTLLKTKPIQSGDIVAFHDGNTLLEEVIEIATRSGYYHCGVLFVTENNVLVYEALSTGIYRSVLLDRYKDKKFTIIKTGITWDDKVANIANSILGERYSWLNFFLVYFHLNTPWFGYICSTYAGAILNAANENINVTGLTPSLLVEDLLQKDCKTINVE